MLQPRLQSPNDREQESMEDDRDRSAWEKILPGRGVKMLRWTVVETTSYTDSEKRQKIVTYWEGTGRARTGIQFGWRTGQGTSRRTRRGARALLLPPSSASASSRCVPQPWPPVPPRAFDSAPSLSPQPTLPRPSIAPSQTGPTRSGDRPTFLGSCLRAGHSRAVGIAQKLGGERVRDGRRASGSGSGNGSANERRRRRRRMGVRW
jgi:hypothetical protein